MEIKYIFLFLSIFHSVVTLSFIDTYSAAPLTESPSTPKLPTVNQEMIFFDYENKDLIEVIYEIAAKKNINIILPVAQNELKIKVTLHIPEPLTIDEAWKRLNQILDIAGYCILPEGEMFKIVKNSKTTSKETTPLYTVPIEKIPDSDERIRYLYYLSNIKITADQNQDIIAQVIKSILTDNGTFNIDTTTNAILITEKASLIKSIMTLIAAIDKADFKEEFEVISLRYTSAPTVAKFFTDNFIKLTGQDAKYNLKAPTRQEPFYFSQNIRMVADNRNNKLYILGKKQAVEKVKDFIITYIDKEQDSGKSVLHVYEPLYLDVATLAPVLRSMVESQSSRGPAQATEGGSTGEGLDRFFDNVIIKPAIASGAELEFSSNKLIIAAKNEDWIIIKKLIEEIDTPQKQVIIEVLIADLGISDIKQLGTISRNAANLAFKKGVTAQAAELNGIILDTPPVNLQSDLLNSTSTTLPGLQPLLVTSPGSMGEPGSTVISLNDPNGKTWSILQLLENFNTSKILSHPHVIANNNKKATILSGEKRLVPDQAVASSGGQVVPRIQIEALVKVNITPRISSTNHVTMDVEVTIQEFLPRPGNARTDRKFTTTATVKSNEVLALGGLIRSAEVSGLQSTPILSKIPILGWLFKRKRRDAEKTNLTVFISPTVILPRLRGGINEYTNDYVELAKDYSKEAELFDGLRDPITRFFFTSSINSEEEINKFLHASYDEDNPLLANTAPRTSVTSPSPTLPPGETPSQTNPQEPASEQTKENTNLDAQKFVLNEISQQNRNALEITPTLTQNILQKGDNKASYAVVSNDLETSQKNETPTTIHQTIINSENRGNRLRNLLKNESNPFLKS